MELDHPKYVCNNIQIHQMLPKGFVGKSNMYMLKSMTNYFSDKCVRKKLNLRCEIAIKLFSIEKLPNSFVRELHLHKTKD